MLMVGFNLVFDWLRRWCRCFGLIIGWSKYKFSEICIVCDILLRKLFLMLCLFYLGYGDLYLVMVIGKVVCGLYVVFGIFIIILFLWFIG